MIFICIMNVFLSNNNEQPSNFSEEKDFSHTHNNNPRVNGLEYRETEVAGDVIFFRVEHTRNGKIIYKHEHNIISNDVELTPINKYEDNSFKSPSMVEKWEHERRMRMQDISLTSSLPKEPANKVGNAEVLDKSYKRCANNDSSINNKLYPHNYSYPGFNKEHKVTHNERHQEIPSAPATFIRAKPKSQPDSSNCYNNNRKTQVYGECWENVSFTDVLQNGSGLKNMVHVENETEMSMHLRHVIYLFENDNACGDRLKNLSSIKISKINITKSYDCDCEEKVYNIKILV